MSLDERTLNLIRPLFADTPEVERVILYGSRAMDRERPESDIDLAIVGNLSAQQLGRLLGRLEELPVPQRFDVQLYDSIRHEGLRNHIDTHGVIIHEATAVALTRSGR